MNLPSFFSNWPWWIPMLLVFGANLVICLVLWWVDKGMLPKIRRGKLIFSAIDRVLYRPLQLILWIVGISVVVSLYADHFFTISVIQFLKIILKGAAIVTISWVAFLLGKEIEWILKEKKNFDATTVELISKLSFIAISFLTLLMILPLFGVKIAGLLAFGSAGGIIVGLGAKDALANVMGGIVIAINKPFKIGDWICSLDEKIEGIVEHIGWRTTMIRQFDKKVLYIPNQSFSNMIFVNASQMTHRRLENLIKIRYSDAKKTNMIIKELRETLSKRKDIDHSQSNHVHLVNFGDSALEIKMTLYTKRTSNADFWAFTEEILTLVYEIIEKHGAQMAFPTTTIDLVDKNQLQNTLPFGQ